LRPREKRPFILWELFQAELPSASDVAGWFRRWPDANIGIVTGGVSKLIVLDIDQGIDLRGDGGYVVAPPSLHPSGEHYAWQSGCSPEERTLAPLPRWSLTATGIPRSGRSLGDWRKLVQEGVPEGQRNSTITSLTDHLLWHGVDAAVVLELLLAWNRLRCRPPLDDAEVAEVVGSILRLH
jgi:hypothetical protein